MVEATAGMEAAVGAAARAAAARVGVGERRSHAHPRGRATISQRGFPHVAHATVSIRGFPQVLFAVAPSGRPAMPRDDGGRPSPPDIGAQKCIPGLRILRLTKGHMEKEPAYLSAQVRSK